jgi:hypothetical protein
VDLDADFPLEVVSSTWQAHGVAASCSSLAIHPNKIRKRQDLETYKDCNLIARVRENAASFQSLLCASRPIALVLVDQYLVVC